MLLEVVTDKLLGLLYHKGHNWQLHIRAMSREHFHKLSEEHALVVVSNKVVE